MLVKIDRLAKTFPGGRNLFSGVSLEFNAGEFVAVVGPSGCGKSTLLRLIAGLDTATHGQVETTSKSVGFVFQEPRLLPWLTVAENIGLAASLRGEVISAEKWAGILGRVHLDLAVRSLYPQQLSGGMKMRTALARALLLTPQIMLMDEPLAALDESTRQILQEKIARIHETSKMLSVFVTHSLSEAVFLADRVIILGAEGTVVTDLRVDLPRPREESTRRAGRFAELLQGLQQEFRLLLAHGSV